MLIPLIALFFLLYQQKYFLAAFCVFIFSLTIKETVSIFWMGVGAVIFIRGNRKMGAAIATSSSFYFLLVTLLVMPSISGIEKYEFIMRYKHLGKSFLEIGISPILKPIVVIKTFFRPESLYFIVILVLPVFIIALNSPFILGGALIITLIVLQYSNQLFYLGSQYQSETLILVFISAVYGFRNIKQSWLMKTFLAGHKITTKRLPFSLIISTAITSLLSFYFFSMTCFGKNSDYLTWLQPSRHKEIAEIATHIPKGKSLTATPELAANFIFRNNVFLCYQRPKEYEYALINLDDKWSSPNILEPFRKELLTSGKYKLIKKFTIKDSCVLLFKKGKSKIGANRPGIIQMPLEKWNKLGRKVDLRHPQINCRLIRLNSEAQVFFRIMEKMDYDFDIQIHDAAPNAKKAYIGSVQKKVSFLNRERYIFL